MTAEGSRSADKANSERNELWEWTKAILIAIGLAVVIRMFLFEPYFVSGQSMEPNLESGEGLIVNKVIYKMREPERGEILVFHAPLGRDYIKRVIGVPGDTVEVRDDTLYVNGKKIAEPYIEKAKKQYREEEQKNSSGQTGRENTESNNNDELQETGGGVHYTENIGPISVPKGELFVLGDNRPGSEDSRAIGTIPLDKVVGRAEVVLWPLPQFRMLGDGS
ncbi:signal peptidase I [Numidum massiliense]|uniref:signal peptidase I n=1 Tax=Numidum massiliense TaxID=1522315 RepID=UPI0006D54DA5|nr:signal peptidase I [Numidum massiliense]